MRKYRLLIEGLNCLLNVEGELAKYGFFTTRFVCAQDEEQAEIQAKEMLRFELADKVQNDENDSPVMLVEEIEEVSSFGEFESHQPGFAWYTENEQGH